MSDPRSQTAASNWLTLLPIAPRLNVRTARSALPMLELYTDSFPTTRATRRRPARR